MIRDLKYSSLSPSARDTTRRQHQPAVSETIERNDREKSAISKVSSPPYSQLSSLEIAFLKRRIRDLQASMDRELASLENDAEGWDTLPWHRRQRLEVYERESEILLEMLDALRHNSRRLDDVMADRLGRLHQRIAPGQSVDGSAVAYWETNMERQIVVQLLNDWWQWLKAKI